LWLQVNRFCRFLLHSKYSRHPPGSKGLAKCGTALATGDVKVFRIRERESAMVSPGSKHSRTGSPVEGSYFPVRGCGCCSESESHKEHWNQTFRPSLTLVMGRFSVFVQPPTDEYRRSSDHSRARSSTLLALI